MKHIAACLALAAGCEVSTVDREQAIVGGSLDPGDPAVVAIVARRTRCDQTSTALECTGTLIAPHVVLTAAHCLLPGSDHGTLEVYVGSPVGDPAGRFIVVDDAIRHPAYDEASHAFDLGLVRLAERAAVIPVALPTATLDPSYVGAAVRVVGYGVTATGTIADGNRRTGAMTVSSVASQTFEATPAPANSCGGDSGGPVFVMTSGGEQLLGVTVSGDSTCTVRAVNSRVDVAVADFIQPYLDANPAATGSAGTIAPTEICTAPCISSTDCPAAMACVMSRCQISGSPAGDLTEVCSVDADCESRACARMWPDACRCLAACDSRPPDGCCSTSGHDAWPAWLVVIWLGRRRSARRVAGGSKREFVSASRAR